MLFWRLPLARGRHSDGFQRVILEQLKDGRVAKWSAFLVLMLVSPMASASDFSGFFTIFLGFPALIFCNLTLSLLLFGSYVRAQKFGLLLLLPLYGATIVLASCVSALSGMFVLDGLRSGDGLRSLVVFLAMAISCISAAVTVTLSLSAQWGVDAQGKRRRSASWGAVVLAVAMSFPVGFDFQSLMQKKDSDSSLTVGYAVLFVLVLILHGLVMWRPSQRPVAESPATVP